MKPCLLIFGVVQHEAPFIVADVYAPLFGIILEHESFGLGPVNLLEKPVDYLSQFEVEFHRMQSDKVSCEFTIIRDWVLPSLTRVVKRGQTLLRFLREMELLQLINILGLRGVDLRFLISLVRKLHQLCTDQVNNFSDPRLIHMIQTAYVGEISDTLDIRVE